MSSRKSSVVLALPLLALTLIQFVVPEGAHAIPAFSRQYKTECSTCHTIYPELNEFGDAFLKNGYVYPGKPGAAATPAEQKEGKVEGLWLSGLPELLPVSFTGTLDVAYNNDAFDGNKVDLSTRSLRLQAGGAFRDVAGFFLTYNLYSQGAQTSASASTGPASNANTPPNNSPDIYEMYAIWRHAFGSPVNFRIGRMEPKLSLWKKSNRVILTPSYASTAYTVGSSFSQGSTPFSLDAPEDALEVNAVLGNRVFVAGGVVDRNGQKNKDGYGHISVKLGGTDLLGHEPELDLENDSVWDYLTLTLGGFGYAGSNGKYNDRGIAQFKNDFYRAGAEADLLYKRFHLKGSGAFGHDDNPTFSSSAPTPIDSKAYAVEGEYMFGAPVNLITLFRYEYQKDLNGNTRRYIPALAYAPLQNTKVSLQYTFTDGPSGIQRLTLASLAISF
ncbi:hypothetical protein GMLC_19040 [Geomonas limicola]|uniref:Uncharacterized protein n=1 Tax=Geomonas limicola TaxID=2740186 RepID=A0A6V8N6W8_9BACT|nr:porin [Geomonas limicola]GFO68325.1 hypothetical protein GMLC_19040 [Geomonas limicola]